MKELTYVHYYHPTIDVKNSHCSLAVVIKNGTPIRYKSGENWINGVYEERRWPSNESGFNAGILTDDSEWFSILRSESVELIGETV